MTDYYVIGRGYTAYGPYTFEGARKTAAALAHHYDGEESVFITATIAGKGYSKYYDDELPPKPTGDVHRPWEE